MVEPYLGQIALFPCNFVPKGWMFCDGQLLNLVQNTALFSILGIIYGGNGKTNFALPRMEDVVSGESNCAILLLCRVYTHQ